MTWIVEYLKEAEADLDKLDHAQQVYVLKAIQKVSTNPLPNNQGGYGKPLGNHSKTKLAGYLKIKLLKLGIRVVYRLAEEQGIMKIIIISVREGEKVYLEAQKRIKKQR